MREPICVKCGKEMTPEDSKIRPEFFMHDACLPEELRNYDPMSDFINANRDTILNIHQEALRRIKYCFKNSRFGLILPIIEATQSFHPMHGEDFNWPEGSKPE